jgi:hypothetical protein
LVFLDLYENRIFCGLFWQKFISLKIQPLIGLYNISEFGLLYFSGPGNPDKNHTKNYLVANIFDQSRLVLVMTVTVRDHILSPDRPVTMIGIQTWSRTG